MNNNMVILMNNDMVIFMNNNMVIFFEKAPALMTTLLLMYYAPFAGTAGRNMDDNAG